MIPKKIFPTPTNRILAKAKEKGYVCCNDRTLVRCMNLCNRGLLIEDTTKPNLFHATKLLLEQDEDDIVSFLRNQSQWSNKEE